MLILGIPAEGSSKPKGKFGDLGRSGIRRSDLRHNSTKNGISSTCLNLTMFLTEAEGISRDLRLLSQSMLQCLVLLRARHEVPETLSRGFSSFFFSSSLSSSSFLSFLGAWGQAPGRSRPPRYSGGLWSGCSEESEHGTLAPPVPPLLLLLPHMALLCSLTSFRAYSKQPLLYLWLCQPRIALLA